MPDTLTRFVAIVLLLVQALASLGRGESLCVPLDFCGDHFAAHSHAHGSHAGRAIVAHRHASADRGFVAEQADHACDHDHAEDRGGDGPSVELGEHRVCCGDHLHFNLIDHELPPRSGAASDLLVPALDLPSTSLLSLSARDVDVPRQGAIDAAWIRSDQRRTIDVASIVV